jgi:hypothetical protein
VIGVFIELGELDVPIEKKDSPEYLGIKDVDLLVLGRSVEDVLKNRDIHRELIAANGKYEVIRHQPKFAL